MARPVGRGLPAEGAHPHRVPQPGGLGAARLDAVAQLARLGEIAQELGASPPTLGVALLTVQSFGCLHGTGHPRAVGRLHGTGHHPRAVGRLRAADRSRCLGRRLGAEGLRGVGVTCHRGGPPGPGGFRGPGDLCGSCGSQ
ncbi:hypothetical protein GTW59_23550 [Streptomyces sp. SID89]|nr:hypothetical protein [Streptomyces sp. SID89]